MNAEQLATARHLLSGFCLPFTIGPEIPGDDPGDPNGLWLCDDGMYLARFNKGVSGDSLVELLNLLPDVLNEVDEIRAIARDNGVDV